MSIPDEKPLDPAAAQMIAKVRRLMIVSGLFTLLGIAAVLAVVGYRVSRMEGSAPAREVDAALPSGAKVVGTAMGEDRIVVTVEVAGATELHVFDANTLQPRGRIRLQPRP